MTKQRAMLLDMFRSDFSIGQHRTAEEILAEAKERMPGISRATVYNNLRSMEKEGFIRRITSDSGADVYDSSFSLHGHLLCTECGRITDIVTPTLYDELCDITGVDVDSYELKVRYVCNSCKKMHA